jgi:hypothetical protein
MKGFNYQIKTRVVAVIAITFFALMQLHAQDFQRVYGTALDNSFTKVIQNSTNYFVLGQDEATNGLSANHQGWMSKN